MLQNPLTIWITTSIKKVVEDSAVHFAIEKNLVYSDSSDRYNILLKNLKRRPAIKPNDTPDIDQFTSSLLN